MSLNYPIIGILLGSTKQIKMKSEIKKLVELGAIIKMPHKTKINEWFSEISISKVKHSFNGRIYYIISPFGEQIYDVDIAVNTFIDYSFTSKNIGYIQKRLSLKGVDLEQYDLETPNQELLKMFEEESKIVDEETKLFLDK